MTNKPVIFLAFANDHERPGGHLPKLAEEARQLHATLDAADQAGLCEVLVHQNVTIATVLDVFQDARYRNRIAIFHYGGHAESYALLLETAAGKTAIADAGGLAAFLGQQTGIQLVFLNGCSSQPQAQGLLDAGVAAVIATAQAIDDAVAVEFAARFYKGLASGATLQTAFHEAAAACQTAHGNQPRHLYFHELLSDASVVMADRWPWALTARPGAELALHWNLPEAVHDPLFGLPQPARCDLPASPYRYLDWYRREDAEVFFGRGYEIRELYQRVTAPDAPPLLLYYGQSGVGKSSLLAAGLLPRLEQVQTVRYTRRDQARGLAGTLAAGLPEAAAGESLLARWRDFEAQTGQPLTLILDQVEEAYTRPHPDRPGELVEFLDLLTALFRDPAARPQGRLILSFRKEWLAEIEKLVAERQLSRAKVFLQRLARRGILETITGPARVERLRQHFGLTVSDDLPGEIADDLLADPSSAVTTTLQVLLSKLWEQAKERDYDHPTFDHALYQELRRKGLLLSDFLEQQLAALRAAQPGAVESGLVFDLLAFHTTPQSTAEQRALAELHAAYAHQEPALPELLGACQDLYLLTDPAKNQPDVKQVSRLAHDTLAPLVRHRFDESDAPGQRARRILESRLSAAAEAQAALEPLGEGDLALVEAGQAGMRAWREPEVNLIGLSRAARERRRKRDRVIRGVLMALVCVIVVVAGVAAWQWKRAIQAEQQAVARMLVAQAQLEFENDPLLGVALALEGLALIPGDLEAQEDLSPQLAIMAQHGRLLKLGDDVENIFVNPNSDVFILDRKDAPGELRSAVDGALLAMLSGKPQGIYFSPDASRFVVSYPDKPGELWRITDGVLLATFIDKISIPNSIYFSPDASTLVVDYLNVPSELRRATDGAVLATLIDNSSIFVNAVHFSSDANTFVMDYLGASNDELRHTTDGTVLAKFGNFFQISPDANTFVVGGFGTPYELRRINNGEVITTLPDEVYSLEFTPDGTIFVINYRGSLGEIRRTTDGASLATFTINEGSITSSAHYAYFHFSPDGRSFVVDCVRECGELRRTTDGALLATLKGKIASLKFSPDATVFIVNYLDSELGGEVRRTVDGIVLEEFISSVDVYFSPDATAFVLKYLDYVPGDLYRTADCVTLDSIRRPVNDVYFSPDSTFFLVTYDDTSAELLRTADGTILDTALPVGTISSIDFSPDPEVTYQVIHYQNGRSELWHTDGYLLDDLELGITQQIFTPDASRLIVRYTDGRAYLLDLDWLTAMRGDPHALTTDELTTDELIRILCEGPMASGLLDEDKLISYLDGRPPSLCQETSHE